MKTTTWKRLTCVLLALLMMLQLTYLPEATAYAIDSRQEAADQIQEPSPSAVESEAVDKREEEVKHFQMNDGSYLAVAYGMPVHYKENGEWLDIDNRLTKTTDSYDVVSLQTDGTTRAVSVHEDVWTNSANSLRVTLPVKLTESSRIGLTHKGFTIRFSLIAGDCMSTAQVEDKMNGVCSDIESAIAVHAASSLSYSAVLPGIDLRYDLVGSSLKENIILSSLKTTPDELTFALTAPGLELHREGDELLFKAGEDDIFRFPAPYMLDAEGAVGSVKAELREQGKGEYLLIYKPDRAWLENRERAWPVTVDPVTQVQTSRSSVQDTYIRSRYPNTDWNGSYYFYCGHGAGRNDETASLVKHTLLPVLESGSVVNSAEVWMRGRISDGTGPIQVNVHPITKKWRIDYVFWNNMPTYDSAIEDFQIIDGSDMSLYKWDITRTVQSWYNGSMENNGLFFFAGEKSGSTGHLAQFNAVDGGATQYWPTIFVFYTNSSGLESGWDYTAMSAGRAGSVYTNNYTGKETASRTDMVYGGNRMPASMDFTHNQNNKDENIGYGLGWRSNYAQTLMPAADNRLNETYYVWTDGDGTRLYFKRDSENEDWKDENGQGYTLTLSDSEYEIIDRDGNSLHFDSSGRLYLMSDGKTGANTVSISYNADNTVQSVTDGAGRRYDFSYSGGLLSTITYRGHSMNAVETVSYGYSNRLLTAVTWQDGHTVSYSYNSDNTLSCAADNGENVGDRVELTYNRAKVSGMSWLSGSTPMTAVTLSYGNHWTKVTDNVGRWCTYQFNNFGNTTSVYNQDGQAVYGRFAADSDSSKPKNLLITASRLQDTVVNLLPGEPVRNETWQQTDIPVLPGVSYTLSGLLQASGALSLCAGTVTASSETDISGKRVCVTLTIPDGVSVLTASGPAARELQLERNGSFNRFNLLKNTDMSSEAGWTYSGTATEDGITSDDAPRAFLNASCLMLRGEASAVKRCSQTVGELDGANHFTFGCWVKPGGVSQTNTNYQPTDGSTAPERRCGVLAELLDDTGAVLQEEYVGANPACPEWQFISGSVQAPGCTQVRFSYVYENNENASWFDGAQLFAEKFAYTYQYDEEGRIQTVTDLDGNTTSYTYRGSSSDIQSITLPGGTVYSYTYTESGLLTGTTSATGITTAHSYDDFGNLTQTAISYEGNSGAPMQSNNTFTPDGNLPATVTAGDRNTVTYSYDADRSLLQSTTDALGNAVSNTYDSMGRLAGTTAGTSSVGYAYADDLLSSITHSGNTATTYGFSYLAAGLTESVNVGSRNLVQNAYNPGVWTLASQTYGNGQSWSYTYDSSDQLTSRTDGTNTFRYYYNGEGAVGRIEKNVGTALAFSQCFYYDTGNRLTRVVERDGAGAVTHEYSWTYDHNDKVTSLTESVNGRSLHYVYAYNADQVAEGMSGDVGRSFTYDGLGRTAAVTTNGLLTTAYTYRTVSDNGTDYATAQIAALHNSYAGGSRNYSYTYDANGNILAVSDGTSTTGYAYDAQGQLVREDNQAAGKTWVYSYDNGGNILSRSEYAYTTGEPGTPTDTVSYTYGDADWGDLLTAYDGQPISYDGIGNMTAFEGWSFLWQGGRQLAGMSNGGTALSFAYNDDGCRVEKTVNGVTHQYIYRGEQLIADVCGNDALYFRYDQNGDVLGFKRYLGEAYGEYTYVKNQQGDIMAVLDCEGSEAATYTYDAWGNILTTGGYDADVTARNPLRYRGYYYDSETGFYYVSSRYYDPEIGRFINADDTSYLGANGDFISYNLFAYCGNNPVTGYDPDGTLDWGNLFKGSSWLAVGVTAIAVGVSVLTCGVAAPAMMAVAAVTVGAGVATAINGVSELGEAATGHNFMRDDVFRGNAKAYNIYAHSTAAVAEIGTMVCGGWLKTNAPRIEAYNNVQNYTYADGAAKHIGKRSYYDSILLKKEIIKYGSMTNEGSGVYTFRAMGTAFSNSRTTFQSGIWELTTINGKGLIGHFLLRS